MSPDIVEDIGIQAELEDDINSFYGVGGSLHNFFSKKIEFFQLGSCKLHNVKVDFGVIDPNGSINGLLGLDFLLEVKAIIDLKNIKIVL